jgi:hypothetical protein
MAVNNQDLTPANGLQGSSPIYDMGTTPNTRAVVSQKVRLLTPAYGTSSALFQMGVVASVNPSETRTIEALRGIGFGDVIAELVPQNTDPMSLSFERTLLYLSNLWQSTGYAAGVDGPVRSLRHHKWPFDVEQQVVFSTIADQDQGAAGGAGSFDGGVAEIQFPTVTEVAGVSSGSHMALITLYEACWWSDWNTTFTRDGGLISESGTATCTDVHDFSSIYGEFLATGNDPSIEQLGSIRYGVNIAGGGGLTG